MSRRFSEDELESLLGAYALDAVDEEEAAAVEQYLRENPRAREEVDRHREVTALLAGAGAPAPEGLWDAIAGALERDVEPPEPSGDLGRVLQLPPPSVRRSPGRAWFVGAAAALVVVVLGVALAVQQQRLDDRLGDLSAAVEDDGLVRAAAVALADPDARVVTLVDPAGSGATATVALLPDGQGYLLPRSLPALGDDRTYQLWALVDGGDPVSAGVLGPDPSAVSFRAAGDPAGFAVTVEPAGGVVVATTDPVLVGVLA